MNFKTVVFLGPSAIGKTYVAEMMKIKYPDMIDQAMLYTTRPPRKDEQPSDRHFVAEDKFNEMVDHDRFIIYDKFGGNLYGFTPESITPNNRHLLTNAWPWLAEQFSKLDQCILVGLLPQDDWREMLINRMRIRGDDETTILRRIELIKKDIIDLNKSAQLINNSGKLFTIKDNSTISHEVLPWIESRLGLS